MPEYGGNLVNSRGSTSELQVQRSPTSATRHASASICASKDVLFNLAGQTSHVDSMSDPRTDLGINCTAQLSLLEACRADNPELRIVFAGTRQIYGRPRYLPVDEVHPIEPVDVNGINKIGGRVVPPPLRAGATGCRSPCSD